MGPIKEKKELSLVEKWNEQMTLIEKKTGIHGAYVIILLVVSVLFVYLNIFDNLITNLVGTVYPAFWTMKSINSKEPILWKHSTKSIISSQTIIFLLQQPIV